MAKGVGARWSRVFKSSVYHFIVAVGLLGSSYGDTDALRQKLIRYIESIRTLEAVFEEKGSQREATGRVFLKRPGDANAYGKLKFLYDAPLGLVVVSTDGTVYVVNTDAQTIQDTPLSSTPLFLFMRQEIRLGDAAVEKALLEEDETIQWTLAQREDVGGGESPSVRLLFRKNPLELSGWVITDPTGNETEISLKNIQKGHEISDDLFQKPTLKD